MRTKDVKYRGYLRALLQPQRKREFRPFEGLSEEPSYLKVEYSTHPKIVEGPDGRLRFLLRSTWRYRYTCKNVVGRMSRECLGDLAICPHTEFCDEEYRSMYYGGDDGGHTFNPMLEDAVDEALEIAQVDRLKDNDGVRGRCPWCPTDFEVRAALDHIEVRAWQDMGAEGPPTDPAWRAHVAADHRCSRDGDGDVAPVQKREPDSVRGLFEARQKTRLRRPGAWHIVSRMRRVWAGSAPDRRVDTSYGRGGGAVALKGVRS